MKYKLLLSGLLFLCTCCPVFAATEGKVTVDAVFIDGGNDWREISIRQSTRTPVIISTDPVGSFQLFGYPQTLTWRHREIINVSTCGSLTLFKDSGTFITQSSSYSVTLASDASGLGQGDPYVVPHQAPVWGIWSGGCGEGGQGAGGAVTFWTDNKKRSSESRTGQ